MVPFKEYRMSTLQVVSLSGIVMGCMLCAFYLGAYFGNKIGFESAMNDNLENLAKVPIDIVDTGKDDVDEKTVTQVYEKLKKDSLDSDVDNDLPTLSKIINSDKEEKKEKINILNNDSVPALLDNSNKKAIGELVEDIQIMKKDEKPEAVEEKKEVKEDVKLIVDGIDNNQNSDSQNIIKQEIQNIQKKTDEEYAKLKEVEKEKLLVKAQEKKDLSLKDKIAEEGKKGNIKIVAKNNEIVEVKKDDSVLKQKISDNNENSKATIKVVGNDVKNIVKQEPTKVATIQVKNEVINVKKNDITLKQIEPKLPSQNLPIKENINNNPQKFAGIEPQNSVANNMPQNTVNNAIKSNIQNGVSSVPRGFYAQIAATERQADAAILVRKVRESGFKAVIEESVVNGTRYYRVLAGPEDTKLHANRMVEQLKREPYINGAPFVKEVR